MKKIAFFLWCVSALALQGNPVSAQLGANEKCSEPIDVGGDILELVDNVTTLTGSVRVIQCNAVLSTAKLVGTQDADGNYETLNAVGAVRYSNGEEAISSKTALYDLTAGTITFTDDVIVTQGQQVMRGGALTYWVDSGRIRFTANEGKRIRGIFHSKSLDTRL